MTIIEGLWCASTLMCGFSVIGMLYVYRSMERSMDVITRALHQMIVQQGVLAYGTAIQTVAKDSKVAE